MIARCVRSFCDYFGEDPIRIGYSNFLVKSDIFDEILIISMAMSVIEMINISPKIRKKNENVLRIDPGCWSFWNQKHRFGHFAATPSKIWARSDIFFGGIFKNLVGYCESQYSTRGHWNTTFWAKHQKILMANTYRISLGVVAKWSHVACDHFVATPSKIRYV